MVLEVGHLAVEVSRGHPSFTMVGRSSLGHWSAAKHARVGGAFTMRVFTHVVLRVESGFPEGIDRALEAKGECFRSLGSMKCPSNASRGEHLNHFQPELSRVGGVRARVSRGVITLWRPQGGDALEKTCKPDVVAGRCTGRCRRGLVGIWDLCMRKNFSWRVGVLTVSGEPGGRIVPRLASVREFFAKSWVFILIGVIVAFGLEEEVGGSIIEDLCTICKRLGHSDEVTIHVEFWPIS